MNNALLWLSVAAAIITWPRAARAGRNHEPRRHRPADRGRGFVLLAGGSIAALCLALFGLRWGGVAAIVAVPVGVVTVARAVSRGRFGPLDIGMPLALDLAAAVLRSGAPVSTALEHAAPAAGADAGQLVHAARLLRLGAGPVEAWRTLAADPRLGTLAAVSVRSAASGVRLAAAWEQLAAELRAQRRAQALSRAQRAGVFAMAPLGLCFLPAFVCLGVIPDVLGIARDVLSGALGGR